MKKIILLGAFAFCSSVFAQDQTLPDPTLPTEKVNEKYVTTDREYNFLTKGLKTTLEQGLDVISGYRIEEKKTKNVLTYDFKLRYLFDKKTNILKGISVVAKHENHLENDYKNSLFLCIPFNNRDLIIRYQGTILQFNESLARCYSIYMSMLYADSEFRTYFAQQKK